MARFSKAAMAAHLEAKVSALTAKWQFDPNNGTAQVRGKSEEALVAYGEFRLCLRLLAEIEEGRVGVS